MTTVLPYGITTLVEFLRPPTHFILDVDQLDVDPLGGPPAWVDVGCDVVEVSIQRGDVSGVDQRPNATLEVGTMSLVVLDRDGQWIPDDMARLFGMVPTGLKPGTEVRFMAGVSPFGYRCVFYGNVTDYEGEWLDNGEHLITISAVDPVARVASVNPTALDLPAGDQEGAYNRFQRLAAMTPVKCTLMSGYTGLVDYREDTFADPLIEQWQKWGDTSLMHLAMRLPATVVPELTAKYVAQDAAGTSWVVNDCQLDPAPSDIPLHWGVLIVSAAGIVNDVLASADRSGTERYQAKFGLYQDGITWYGWGRLMIVTSDGGSTWGCQIADIDRTGTINHGAEWDTLPIGAELELVVLGSDGQPTGRSWSWRVNGATSPSGGSHWLSGLIAMDGSKDFPIGQIVNCTFARTNKAPNEDAKAQRSISEASQAAHGLQDYRRLDLPVAREIEHAQAWANRVITVAAEATTYIGEAEVRLHLPGGPNALQVDLLDRLTVRKQYVEYEDRVVRYVADVVGIDDEVDASAWTRRFHLVPVGVPVLEGV